MTIGHSSDVRLELSKNSYIADSKTVGELTKIVIVNNGGNELFTSNGDFDIIDLLVVSSAGAIDVDVNIIPDYFGLSKAYPNPFNPSTSVDLAVPSDGFVSVKVYNLMGQVVSTLHEGSLTANSYSFMWDAKDMSSGMYLVKAESAGEVDMQKIMLMK
jgi:hypothetical protein